MAAGADCEGCFGCGAEADYAGYLVWGYWSEDCEGGGGDVEVEVGV